MTTIATDRRSASSDQPIVDLVIVNWNSGERLGECLTSIPAIHREGFRLGRIVVVDNASSDGSADRLGEIKLPLTLIRNKTNRGFAAACNQAAVGRAAASAYVLFLNPDTRLLPESLERPIRFLEQRENDRIGIVGVQLLNDRGEVTPTCARFLTPPMIARKMVGLDHLPLAGWTPHFMVDWDHRTSRIVDHVMGAFFLVRRDLFERLGGFDERFFVYLEDLDFSLRAKRTGFDSFYLADAQLYHKGGGSSQQARAASLYYSLTSRILYAYKHFNRWTATLLTLGTLFVEPVARLVFAIVRRSPSQLADTLKAYALLWRAVPRGLVVARRPDAA